MTTTLTRTRARFVELTLVVFGVYSVLLGLFMLVAPGTFFDTLGAFGIRNDHYIFDNASFELPLRPVDAGRAAVAAGGACARVRHAALGPARAESSDRPTPRAVKSSMAGSRRFGGGDGTACICLARQRG